MINPSTRLASCTSMALSSASTSSRELERMRSYPAASATSAAPRVACENAGFSMSPTMIPIVFDRPVLMLRATSFGRYPSSAAASCTRWRTFALTAP